MPCCQTVNVCINIVSSYRWQYSLKKRFGSCIQSTIQRIHLRYGAFGLKIRFWILVSKRNIRFQIKNPDLDFSKETHPSFFSKREKTCKLKKAQATSVDATSGTQGNGQIG